jgi:lysophospholipase L1-like esterase
MAASQVMAPQKRAALLSIAAAGALWSSAAEVMSQTAKRPALPPKECAARSAATAIASPLPNSAAALKQKRKLVILAMGAPSDSGGSSIPGGHYGIVERLLEATFNGLDVKIVHRGVSGELAADAAGRIKTQVALTGASLVLWQVGTADALAQIPAQEFRASVSQAIEWLRAHKTDVLLVGSRYARRLVDDPQYQAIRNTVHDISREHRVTAIALYALEEELSKVKASSHAPDQGQPSKEAVYVCLAEHIAQAISTELAKP